MAFQRKPIRSSKWHLIKILPWLQKLGTTKDVSSYLKYLYRIRVGSLADYRRADIFHIPFEKRQIVSPQRYSILGLPSLYLGGSVWVCWEEMNRPAFEQIQVSRFKAVPMSNVRVLDFAYRPAVMARFATFLQSDLHKVTDNAEFILSYAMCWPLLADCSIRVRYPDNPFVPEYVVPQLLLQWIRDESHFEGIRYFSMRIAQHEDGLDAEQIQAAASAAANYAFPTVRKASTGHCKQLSSQFELSMPMAWPVIQNVQMITLDPESGPPRWILRLHENSKILYLNTSFYSCERKINSLPCRSVTDY